MEEEECEKEEETVIEELEYIRGVTPKYERIEKYVFRKFKKYKVVYGPKVIGVFDTLKEAIDFKKKMIQEGVINPKRTRRPFKDYQNRYIQKTPAGNWTIRKKVGAKMEGFGTYHSLEDAREERDYLESIDWDYDNME